MKALTDDQKPLKNKLFVGGGTGIAMLAPAIIELNKTSNKTIVIIGAKNKNEIIFENKLKKISNEVFVSTDDGSKGTKGFVSNVLQDLIDKGEKIDIVWAIGPVIMMKVVADLTKKYDIKTMVSLNQIMVDGTGMGGGCRVTVGGKIKFACVHGPEFDGHLVDFQNLMLRNRRFIKEEEHACKIAGVKI